LIVALITPLDEEGRVQRESLREMIGRALPYSDALMIGEGVIGEGLSLPNPVRLELLQGSAELVAGKSLFSCAPRRKRRKRRYPTSSPSTKS